MGWVSSPGLDRLIGLFAGLKMHWAEGGLPRNSSKTLPGTAFVSSSHSNLVSPVTVTTEEGRMVREDLSRPDWEGLPLAEPSPSKKSVKDSLFSESLDGDFTVISPPKDQPTPMNQGRFRKCLHCRRRQTAQDQVRHQLTNWALLMAPSAWWHHPGNQVL